MKFFPDVPVFAAEVRSENDYGPKAEEEMAANRADYFAAGCQVIWDVDLLGADVVRVDRADDPDRLPAGRDRRSPARRARLDDAGGRPVRVKKGIMPALPVPRIQRKPRSPLSSKNKFSLF